MPEGIDVLEELALEFVGQHEVGLGYWRDRGGRQAGAEDPDPRAEELLAGALERRRQAERCFERGPGEELHPLEEARPDALGRP